LTDRSPIEPGGDQIVWALILLHIPSNEGIEHLIRRKGILVLLVGT
jgi:hypothetical protein